MVHCVLQLLLKAPLLWLLMLGVWYHLITSKRSNALGVWSHARVSELPLGTGGPKITPELLNTTCKVIGYGVQYHLLNLVKLKNLEKYTTAVCN